jgi:hypothetical protein
MPTIPGHQRTNRPISPSDALCHLLATGTALDAQTWQSAFHAATESGDLALLTPFRDTPTCRDADRQAIQLALITHTARNQLFLRVLQHCLDWFTAAGIPARVLKGAATMQDCYDDLGQRRLGDIDLLVPKEHLAEAAALLTTNGFQPLLPTLTREVLQDPHVLAASGEAHHHWPPLVGPDGVVIELHWTLGDGFTGLNRQADALWQDSTPLPIGQALGWPWRILHAALAATAAVPSPRAVADLIALLQWVPARSRGELQTLLDALPAATPTVRLLHHLLAHPASWPDPDMPVPMRAPTSPWRRRLSFLRTPAHLMLFLHLGWQAWRYPRWLARLPLPKVAEALTLRPRWREHLTIDEVVAYVGFWQRQCWLARPSYCLQRSALLFAGLTAIGETPTLVFGLDPEHPTPIGHAWVERDGLPFLEDNTLIARMVTTYRHSSGNHP